MFGLIVKFMLAVILVSAAFIVMANIELQDWIDDYEKTVRDSQH